MTRDTAPIRVGVVGCGAVAGNHAEAYRVLDGVATIACSDVDADRARAFATRHGIPAAVTSVDELLDLGVHAVSVCTPHPVHEEVVAACAARGVHVLCEKPLAVEAPAARRMVDACDAAGVRLGAVFQRRFWPAAQRIRAAIDDGTLGEPVLARASVLLHRDPTYYTATPWRGTWAADGGGVLMTQAVHYADLLRWTCGPAAWVHAVGDTFVHGDRIEVEDTIAVTIRFASGAIGQLLASTALTPGLGAELVVTGRTGASAGLVEFPEGTEARNHVWGVPGETAFDAPLDAAAPEVALTEINASLVPFHALQVAEFVEAIRSDREPAITGRDALATLDLMSAAYESMRVGRPVRVEGPEADADRPRHDQLEESFR